MFRRNYFISNTTKLHQPSNNTPFEHWRISIEKAEVFWETIVSSRNVHPKYEYTQRNVVVTKLAVFVVNTFRNIGMPYLANLEQTTSNFFKLKD